MKHKISSILLSSAFLFSVSCTDLDEKVFDKIPLDDYGKTDSEVQTIVGGAYASLRGFSDADKGGTNSYPTCEYVFFLSEIASDEACIPTRGTDWNDGGRYLQVHRHEWKADNIMLLSAWKYCYQGIASVNTIIYQVDQSTISEEAKNKSKAELRGVRAYYYSQLLDMFGNVPIVTSFDIQELPENSARADVSKFVEEELLDIINDIPATKSYGRFTQTVAYSLLARLYINAEVYTGTPRWQDCIDVCEKVNGYILGYDFFSAFATNNEQSNEIIFAIPYDHKVGTVGNYLASMTYHYNQKYAFSVGGTYPWCGNGISAQPGLYSSFDEADARRNSLLIGQQYNLANGQAILMDDGNPLNYTEEISNIENALQNEGARLMKYEVKPDDQWERDNDWVLIRYAEIIMMKAEANFRLGYTANAESLINDLRKRAGLQPTSNLTLQDIDNEWKHEFAFEGLRRTVNIRFGTFFEPWWEKGITPRSRQIFLIPQSVLDLNTNLKQNPL